MNRVRRPFVIAFVTTLVTVFALYAGAAFGVFGHRCPRLNANRTAAIASLRHIHSAQGQFHAVAGRYGTFPELSAAIPLAESGRPLDPPVLSGAFKSPLPDGTILRSGYRFRILLTDDTWCAWAWPETHRTKKDCTLFVSGATDDTVLATENDHHEGDRGPGLTIPVAGTTNADGNFWRVVY